MKTGKLIADPPPEKECREIAKVVGALTRKYYPWRHGSPTDGPPRIFATGDACQGLLIGSLPPGSEDPNAGFMKHWCTVPNRYPAGAGFAPCTTPDILVQISRRMILGDAPIPLVAMPAAISKNRRVHLILVVLITTRSSKDSWWRPLFRIRKSGGCQAFLVYGNRPAMPRNKP